MLDQLGPGDRRVLDLGCGVGAAALYLALLRRVRSRSMWAQSLVGGDALQHCHRTGLLEYRMLRFEGRTT